MSARDVPYAEPREVDIAPLIGRPPENAVDFPIHDVQADVPFDQCLLVSGIVDPPTRGCPTSPEGTNLHALGDHLR